MNKYLTKLKAGNSTNSGIASINNGTASLNTKFNFTGMACANGYKEGLQHKFESDDVSDIILLINIIRKFRLDVKITDITKTSFTFESPNLNIQIFFFRICRYVRHEIIKKILTDTILINKAGVKIQNAFLLAHYYNYDKNGKIPYFNTSMDGFYDPTSSGIENNTYLNKPFKNLKDLKKELNKVCTITYNYMYMFCNKNRVEDRKIVFSLLKDNDFKAAEKYLLFIFK